MERILGLLFILFFALSVNLFDEHRFDHAGHFDDTCSKCFTLKSIEHSHDVPIISSYLDKDLQYYALLPLVEESVHELSHFTFKLKSRGPPFYS